jgi:hypothetical protein
MNLIECTKPKANKKFLGYCVEKERSFCHRYFFVLISMTAIVNYTFFALRGASVFNLKDCGDHLNDQSHPAYPLLKCLKKAKWCNYSLKTV